MTEGITRQSRPVKPIMRRLGALLLLGLTNPAAAETIVVRTDGHHFSLRIVGVAHTEQLNHLHGFDIALETAHGRPVSGATIVITGERRYAPNPLPTMPQVRPGPAAGSYRAEGLRFHIPGEWHLDFAIQSGEIHDRAVLGLMVE
jgi:hypothetical protein